MFPWSPQPYPNFPPASRLNTEYAPPGAADAAAYAPARQYDLAPSPGPEPIDRAIAAAPSNRIAVAVLVEYPFLDRKS